jgi:hypothetical protein
VHIDLVGPTTTKGLKGERYFMLLVDDYTRMTAVFFLKNKSKAFENFKIDAGASQASQRGDKRQLEKRPAQILKMS